MEIRRAEAADIPEMSAVIAQGWRYAFSDRINKAWMEGMKDGHFIPTLTDGLASGAGFVSVEEDGSISGVITCGGATREQERGCGEVTKMYVLPGYHRRGRGGALMAAAIAELCAMGFSRCCVMVLDTNKRAQAFYASFGFAPSGKVQPVTYTGDYLIDEIWERDL